jgi:hypothetical protein
MSVVLKPVEEVWIFGGTRRLDGKKVHAWLPVGSDPKDEFYFRPAGSQVVGSEYVVRVVRDGDKISKYGLPTYQRRHDNEAVRATLEAAHRAAETVLRLAALERNDKRHSALDAAIDPLCDLICSASIADRDAIVVYVLRRLNRAW